MFSFLKKAIAGESEFRRLANRVLAIRNGGHAHDGIHTLYGAVKITDDDYLLMGCDNACTARNFPDVPRDQLHDGRWFTASPSFSEKNAGYNYHGTRRKDGSLEIESFYSTLPCGAYQSAPEEVAWHYIRVKELRASGMEQPQRIATLKAEAALKPWLAM